VAGDQPQQGGLTGAVGADQAGAAAPEGAGDGVQGDGAVRPGEREVVQHDRGGRSGHEGLPGRGGAPRPRTGVSAWCWYRSGASSGPYPLLSPHARGGPAGTVASLRTPRRPEQANSGQPFVIYRVSIDYCRLSTE